MQFPSINPANPNPVPPVNPTPMASGVSSFPMLPFQEQDNNPTSQNNPTPQPSSENALGNFVAAIPDSIKSLYDTTVQNTKDIQQSSFNAIGSDVSNAAQDIQTGVNAGGSTGFAKPLTQVKQVTKAVVQGGLGTLSDTISYFLAPLSAAVKTVTDTIAGNNPNAQGISDIPALQKAMTSQAMIPINAAGDKLNKLAQENPTVFKAIGDTLNVALTALGGREVPEAGAQLGEGVSEDLSKVKNALTPAEKAPVASQAMDTLQSRIKDATPDYDPKMIGQKIQSASGDVVNRVPEESSGVNKPRPVTTSASETETGTEMNNIKDYPDKGTALEKQLAVSRALKIEETSLRTGLQSEDISNPLDADAEKTKVTDLVKSNLPPEIKDKLGYVSPEDEKGLTPAQIQLRQAQTSGTPMPKTALGRYTQQVLDATDAYDGTREGKLDLRQAVDKAYKIARGKLAFGGDTGNVLDETNTDIRNALNKDLADTSETDTEASLKKQTLLHRGNDVLISKAQAESETAFGRIEQQHPMLRVLVNQLRRRSVLLPLTAATTILGATALTTYLKKLLANAVASK